MLEDTNSLDGAQITCIKILSMGYDNLFRRFLMFNQRCFIIGLLLLLLDQLINGSSQSRIHVVGVGGVGARISL